MAKREIKFRGKRKDNGEWAYGYYFYSSGSRREPHIIHLLDDRDLPVVVPAIPETVGQYIGLKDTNGKAAYFDDIAQDKDGDTYVVRWDEKKGVAYLKGIGKNYLGADAEAIVIWAVKKQEIIGNVHENPELLEVTK